jgi:erythromycin esterase-like protein
MLSSAIGALWRFDAELAPLVPFLFERARAGALALGGIDDQVGGLGSFYENDDMPAALSAYLAGGRRAECTDLLRRRTHWTGGSHSEPERSRSLRCLADIAAAARRARHPDRTTRDEHLEMVASLVREFARDPMLAREPADMNGFIRARDRSMFVNFRWLAGRLGPRARIIVWAANSHIAKDSSPREYAESRNFGSFVSQAYRRRAFALGFSALSGTHYWTRQEPNRPFAAAAPGSLEALAIAGSGSDAAYLDAARLARLGAVTGSLYLHRPRRTLWSAAMDAIVVFRAERAPRRTD